MDPVAETISVFGATGPLAAKLQDFTARMPQVRMAAEVARTICEGGISVIEAPTGVGKSFAYLVPAILSGRKVVVSTAYRTLQDQLMDKDIPLLLDALDLDTSVEVAKGRSNYVCHYKWHMFRDQDSLLEPAANEDAQAFDEIELRLTDRTFTGDVAYLEHRPSGPALRDIVSLPVDCLGYACTYAQEPCYVDSMRRRAQEANLVITNHDLLIYSLKESVATGLHELVPEADVYILDEAHHLEDIATRVLAAELTVGEIASLLNSRVFRRTYQRLGDQRRRLEDTCGLLLREAGAAADGDGVVHGPLAQALNLAEELDAAAQELTDQVPASESAHDSPREASARKDMAVAALELLAKTARDMAEPDPLYVRYVTGDRQQEKRQAALVRAPLDPASALEELLFALGKTIVCTSATLTVNQSFDNFRLRTGLLEQPVAETQLPHVFDYRRQALLFLPKVDAFDFRQREPWYDSIKHIISALVDITDGDTLCLFTSYAALREVHDELRDKARHGTWQVRSQEDGNPGELIQWLRETPHSVLCATRSFWEGIDIPGDAVVSVIIDKLPFVPPNDPVYKYRTELLNDRYGEGNEWWAWNNYALPAVSLSLKQGFGRLIRRTSDRGVVTILDSRLTTKGYRFRILKDLPPARTVRYVNQVRAFFK